MSSIPAQPSVCGPGPAALSGRPPIRAGLAVRLLSALLLALLVSLPTVAAATEQSLSQPTFQALQSAQELLEAGEPAAAIERLERLLAATAKRPYEQAVTLQTLGHAHLAQDDYAGAIDRFTRSLELGVLPNEAAQRLRYNLAQLHLASEDYPAALAQLKSWFEAEPEPGAEALVLLGSLYLQLQRYRDALPPLHTAIERSEQPREPWYQALLGAYYELQDYQRCEQLLREMLQRFPERGTYWRQLSGIHLLRDDYAGALEVMELAYLGGHLEAERDLLNLVQLYRHGEAPYKAAALAQREIERGHIEASPENWELVANAWIAAREVERAIAALERAGSAGGAAELGLQLARLHIERHEWPEAVETLQPLLKRERLEVDARGRGWLLLGIARYELGRLGEARQAFEQALEYEQTGRDAEQWLAFIADR